MEDPIKKVKKHKANIPRESSDFGDDVHMKLKDTKRTKKKDKTIDSGSAQSEELNSKTGDELESRKTKECDEENNEVGVTGAVDDNKRIKKKKDKKKIDKTCDYIESGVMHRDGLSVTAGSERKSKKTRECQEENSEENVTKKLKKKRKKMDIDIEESLVGAVDDKTGKKKKKKKAKSVGQDGLEKTMDESEHGHKKKKRKSGKDSSEVKNSEEGSDAQICVSPEKPKS